MTDATAKGSFRFFTVSHQKSTKLLGLDILQTKIKMTKTRFERMTFWTRRTNLLESDALPLRHSA